MLHNPIAKETFCHPYGIRGACLPKGVRNQRHIQARRQPIAFFLTIYRSISTYFPVVQSIVISISMPLKDTRDRVRVSRRGAKGIILRLAPQPRELTYLLPLSHLLCFTFNTPGIHIQMYDLYSLSIKSASRNHVRSHFTS